MSEGGREGISEEGEGSKEGEGGRYYARVCGLGWAGGLLWSSLCLWWRRRERACWLCALSTAMGKDAQQICQRARALRSRRRGGRGGERGGGGGERGGGGRQGAYRRDCCCG